MLRSLRVSIAVLTVWTGIANAAPTRSDANAEDLFKQGEREEAGGHLLRALELYRTSARRFTSRASTQRVQTRIDAVTRQLASVRVDPWSLPPGARVLIGGVAVEPGSKRKLDPGTVAIEIQAPGYQKYTQSVELRAGEEREISPSLTIEERARDAVPAAAPPPPAAPAAPPAPESPAPAPSRSAPAAAVAPQPEPEESSSAVRPLGWVMIAVGGSALVAGGITGYLALKRGEYLQRECPVATACTPEGMAAARAGDSFATISTASFIGGAGLIVLGGAFVLAGGPSHRGVRIQPAVGGLSIAGSM